jgi:hypothetical protein
MVRIWSGVCTLRSSSSAGVLEVVVELPVAPGAGGLVAHFQPVAGFDFGAGFADFGADAVDVVVDVDAVGHRLLVAVLHHQVLVEEAEGLLVGRGGEADQRGVEVLEHLPPQVVDRAVRFVGDDDVEGLDRDRRVVVDRLGLLEQGSMPAVLCSSSSTASSRPLSIEYMRWMVRCRRGRWCRAGCWRGAGRCTPRQT